MFSSTSVSTSEQVTSFCWAVVRRFPGFHAVSSWARLPGSDSATREDGEVEPNRFRLSGEKFARRRLTFVSLLKHRCAQDTAVTSALSSDPSEGWRQHHAVVWRFLRSSGRSRVCEVPQCSKQASLCSSVSLYPREWLVSLLPGTLLMSDGWNGSATATCPPAWQPSTKASLRAVALSGRSTLPVSQ